MEIYGADFSGARDASKGIYYTKGILSGSTLTIEEVKHCDDRLDLFSKIINSDSPWGLDFPFAIPAGAYAELGLKDWESLLDFVMAQSREEFMGILDGHHFEGRCRAPNVACRITDAESKSFSPLKRYNPKMRAMTYGGLKMLAHLRRRGVGVYPFTKPDPSKPRVYEVYPSNTWPVLGGRGWKDIGSSIERFNSLNYPVEVRLPKKIKIQNQDSADSLIACITLAVAIKNGLEDNWGEPPPNATEEEWEVHRTEGLIIRI
ncbi:MAG: hypothetical protein GXO65_04470 [Euryarchaeota archaeon]|nr:hypothetical protein [Euryarchaeota archaeon]